MMSPIRVALYLRISRDFTGEGLAIERQREACLAIAKLRGWVVVGEYVDSLSAYVRDKDRPGYSALVDAYRAGMFDALICWDLDRLTRQPRQLEDWIDAAEGRNFQLVTANGEVDMSTDGGRMFVRIKAAVARAEVERKGARQRAANRQRADKGRPPLGVRLTGYTTAGALVDDEAKTVRRIFEQFAAGDSLKGITAALNAERAPTRTGRPWHPSSVRTILTNERYAGRVVYDGDQVDVTASWEPIVDDGTFDLVQTRLSDPGRRTAHSTDRRHLGSSLYRCGVCGDVVRAYGTGRYRCVRACVNRTRSLIDDVVIGAVEERLALPDAGALLAVDTSDQAGELSGQVRQLRARRVQVDADYDDGLIDGRRYAVALARVTTELDDATATLARLSASPAGGVLAADDPVAAFRSAPLMIQRAVVDYLMTVRLLPALRGRKSLDLSTIDLIPKR